MPSDRKKELRKLCSVESQSLQLALVLSLAATVAYNRDVRPILSDNCFTCHGPDSAARKAGLRLDQRPLALAGGKSGTPAIVPGKPEAGELIKRITAEDEDDRMPPVKSGKKLTGEQIGVLRRWIAEGAEYQPHWAFIRPIKPSVPTVADP